MGGWRILEHPFIDSENTRSCKCGNGKVIEQTVITEESDYPPFEKFITHTYTTCQSNCECLSIKEYECY